MALAGVYWYTAICKTLGLDGGETFRACIQALTPEVLKGPFNVEGRDQAGLPRDWYASVRAAVPFALQIQSLVWNHHHNFAACPDLAHEQGFRTCHEHVSSAYVSDKVSNGASTNIMLIFGHG